MPALPNIGSSRRMKLWGGGKAEKKGDLETRENSPKEDAVKSEQTKERLESSNGESNDENGRPLVAALKTRKHAVETLYSAAEAFHASLVKRKPLPFSLSNAEALQMAMSLDEASEDAALMYPASSVEVSKAAREGATRLRSSKDRLLPIESLALAMATVSVAYKQKSDHTELGLQPNKEVAAHLSHLAGMQLALAVIQKSFAENVSACFLDPLARQQAGIESLRTAEKTRQTAEERCTAAEKKRDKVREKGERRRELEEEARSANAMYEDAQNDVQMRLTSLTDTEQNGVNSSMAIVHNYIHAHQRYLQSQLDIVRSVQMSLSTLDEASVYKGKTINMPSDAGTRLQELHVEQPIALTEQQESSSSSVGRPTVLTRMSTSSTHASGDARPPSRSSMADAKKQSKRTGGRSKSFSGSAPDLNAENDNASSRKSESLSKRFKSALTKSTSTKNILAMNADGEAAHVEATTVSPPPLLQKQDSSSSSEGKVSNWSNSLLMLRREQSSKAYKVMEPSDTHQIPRHATRHDRDLSHVREGTDEFGEIVTFTGPKSRLASDIDESFAVKPLDHFEGYGNNIGLTPGKTDNFLLSPPNSALNSQWTGYSAASSDGGDPFGGSSVDPINKDLMRSH